MKKINLFLTAVAVSSALLFVTGCQKEASQSVVSASGSSSLKVSNMVNTPYGLKPSSQVHHIAEGTEVKVIGNRIKLVNSTTGQILEDHGAYSESTTSSKTTSTLAVGNGYYVSGLLPTNQSLKSFATNFIVPSNPNGSVTQFIWNGAQNAANNATCFMQPVLEWSNTTDGLDYWTIATWYAIGNNYYDRGHVRVYPGTNLTAKMELISSSYNAYKYKISFVGYASADQTVTFRKPATEVIQCFEPYSNIYTDFSPDSYVRMNSMKLYYTSNSTVNQPIFWEVLDNSSQTNTPSGRNTEILNNNTTNSNVYFYFR